MDYETKKLSKCCKELADIDNGVHYCVGCGENCEYEEVCELCEGAGTVTVDEFDEDSKRYQPTGTKRCLCKMTNLQEDNQE